MLEGKPVETKLGTRWPAARVKPFARALLTAVAAMHANEVAHCDLKPENLVFGNAEDWASVVVIDLGCWRSTGTPPCPDRHHVCRCKCCARAAVGCSAVLAAQMVKMCD